MGAKRVEDLIVWQLADQVRINVHRLTESGPASCDWRFRDQIRDAASSATRNIAEGFGRFRHKEFAQFLRIARGSLYEISDELRDGVIRGYWTAPAVDDAKILCKRAAAAAARLIDYLANNPVG